MTEDEARLLFLDHCQPGNRGTLERHGERPAIAAILALAAPAEGWQPIETHDGSPDAVQLWFPAFPSSEIMIGVWCPWSEPYGGVLGGDWKDRDTGDTFENGDGEQVFPTHWMPLPAAPTGGRK